ncbi:MAG TPA: hypothetical protein VE057_13365 [Archangium sp.]|nr:hypothetical protein [Archangium sp.]
MPASLADLLNQTLLFTASPKPRLVANALPIASLAGRAKIASGESPADRKIWEFEQNGLDGVRNVSVRQRTMNDMRMSVCREVKWGDVKVTYQGRTLGLPLTDRFLLRTYYLPEGTIPESNTGYWQLPMKLDQSFQRLFGFQLQAGQLQPLSDADLQSRDLLAAPSPVAFNRARNGTQQGVPPLRVLVCMALGCAKERNDFEPGGVLGAARLMPHVMLAANLPVESMEATVRLAREPTTPHTRHDNEEMTLGISSGFFTDRNDTLLPIPYWNNLFDYYWIDPPVGSEVKVVRRDRPLPRERVGLIKEVDIRSSRGSSWIAGYKPRLIKKAPRQGEFDNIHMAPKMKLPASVLAKIPSNWPRETTMAPFCVHDCFHVHWRWGRGRVAGNPKWVRGWGADAPYQEIGAPMVPRNQDVTVKMLSACSMAYTAKIHAPVVGNWQIVMHHGGAYALSYTAAADAMSLLNDVLTSDLRGEGGAGGRWANFYWHLRYALVEHSLRALDPTDKLVEWLEVPDTHAERLSWDAGGFRAARDL